MNDRGPRTPASVRIGWIGWIRVLLRGTILGTLTFSCLGLLLLIRLLERPLCGVRRPITPYITQFVCRSALVVLGIGFKQKGDAMRGQGAIVSNHVSWLDIFALNARKRVYFVSKSEVAQWPVIGWLARATGAVFISRDAKEAGAQKEIFERRLAAGHELLFFPEGTSTDGLRVLTFKSTLFEAFFNLETDAAPMIQPITLVYRAPPGQCAHFYGWWGEMEFGDHLLKTLAAPRQGSVETICHPPARVADFADRKALAKHCEEAVRSGLDSACRAAREGESSFP